MNAFQFDISFHKTAIYTFIAQASRTPVELLRKTKRDFNFPYIYHKGAWGEGGQFEPLDADLTRSAFTLPAKLVAY